jgi:hypothetical protein
VWACSGGKCGVIADVDAIEVTTITSAVDVVFITSIVIVP